MQAICGPVEADAFRAPASERNSGKPFGTPVVRVPAGRYVTGSISPRSPSLRRYTTLHWPVATFVKR